MAAAATTREVDLDHDLLRGAPQSKSHTAAFSDCMYRLATNLELSNL